MSELAERIAERVVPWLGDDDVVNLGIGIPTLVANHLGDRPGIVLQTENGMLGVGPTPEPADLDPTLVNAGKLPVSELPGASYFSSSESFAMIRGGHIDVAVLGALQVDARGMIANWSMPGRPVLGVGGAMDLLVGVKRVIVATSHLTKQGDPKVVDRLSYPQTATRPADLIVTERATFRVDAGRLHLVELTDGVTIESTREHTGADFDLAASLAWAGGIGQLGATA